MSKDQLQPNITENMSLRDALMTFNKSSDTERLRSSVMDMQLDAISWVSEGKKELAKQRLDELRILKKILDRALQDHGNKQDDRHEVLNKSWQEVHVFLEGVRFAEGLLGITI